MARAEDPAYPAGELPAATDVDAGALDGTVVKSVSVVVLSIDELPPPYAGMLLSAAAAAVLLFSGA